MAQCRPYVAGQDCVACFDAAAVRLRGKCGAANGARVIFDGCVIRYESTAFFDQASHAPGEHADLQRVRRGRRRLRRRGAGTGF